MKKVSSLIGAGAALLMMASCAGQPEVKSYNEGINIIPMPQSLVVNQGTFVLKDGMAIGAQTDGLKTVADYFASKMSASTGYDIKVSDQGIISLLMDTIQVKGQEEYWLEVKPEGVTVTARTPQGAFYGMQSLMQLFPAEIESTVPVKGIAWEASAVSIKDYPRFAYRGVMLDVCRHFMPVENIKKQLDVMALFKINRMHWHLTDDQGWRIEIKSHPELTEIGSKRVEGEGFVHEGYYTQEQVKEIVQYAADRFITIIPEIELPGHELAAIAAHPELACVEEPVKPRNCWGVEEIVMCAGKEEPFELLTDVIQEVAPLFPGEYFHVGGDECPKVRWSKCPLCQARIRKEGLKADSKHTAEQRLQSYFVQRMGKVVEACGKKMIGWDEILEGGLAPNATVMSWQGETGGIAAALMGHDAIMTPAGNGLYLDYYQGDPKIEPVAFGGYFPIEKIYSYNPVPDTLVAMKKDHHIVGVQANAWSEYYYSEEIREYRMYPRVLALAEIGWTELDKKSYEDFIRRINNAYVRLDAHQIHYHIPLPEQPVASCDHVTFLDTISVAFQTSRPEKMVYTLDGSEPNAGSQVYESPIFFSESGTVKIATLLPSGKMSRVRTVEVVKSELQKAVEAENLKPGLVMKVTDGMYLTVADMEKAAKPVLETTVIGETKELVLYRKASMDMRHMKQYAAVATGYIEIPEDGVYYVASDFEEVWIGGHRVVNNEGEVKKFSRKDTSIALQKGLHEFKVVFLGHNIGGFPSNWIDGNVSLRESGQEKFVPVSADQLFH